MSTIVRVAEARVRQVDVQPIDLVEIGTEFGVVGQPRRDQREDPGGPVSSDQHDTLVVAVPIPRHDLRAGLRSRLGDRHAKHAVRQRRLAGLLATADGDDERLLESLDQRVDLVPQPFVPEAVTGGSSQRSELLGHRHGRPSPLGRRHRLGVVYDAPPPWRLHAELPHRQYPSNRRDPGVEYPFRAGHERARAERRRPRVDLPERRLS